MATLFPNVPVSIHRLGRCEAVVAPAQMQDLRGRGPVYSGKSPLSDNSSRVRKVGSSVADIGLVGGGLRCRARHHGCVVPSLSESDSQVHRSSVPARCFLSPYWTTSEEASLVQRCLGENPLFQQFASRLTMLPSQRDDWVSRASPTQLNNRICLGKNDFGLVFSAYSRRLGRLANEPMFPDKAKMVRSEIVQ